MKTKALTMGLVAIVLILGLTVGSLGAEELGPANPTATQDMTSSVVILPEAVLGPFGIFVPGPNPVPPFIGTTINFEGFPEATLIATQFSGLGVTFTQDDGGTPMIDNKNFLFAYESSSGDGVLTGSTTGGATVPTVAGIIAQFSSPAKRVGAFLSDTDAKGDYTVTIYDTGNLVIDTLTVLASDLPHRFVPGCDPFPSGGWTGTGCGVFVGFDVGSSIISKIQFGPSSAFDDGFAIDDLVFEATQEVPVDIKPTSCPNPLNTKSRGVLPVAILGTVDFDATQVDITTVALAGVSAILDKYEMEDVATPFNGISDDDCHDCTEDGPDGFMDIVLYFYSQDIVDAIGSVEDGECLYPTLTGTLLDGTPIEGTDPLLIKKK
jgi:hypothetical protein